MLTWGTFGLWRIEHRACYCNNEWYDPTFTSSPQLTEWTDAKDNGRVGFGICWVRMFFFFAEPLSQFVMKSAMIGRWAFLCLYSVTLMITPPVLSVWAGDECDLWPFCIHYVSTGQNPSLNCRCSLPTAPLTFVWQNALWVMYYCVGVTNFGD